MAYERIVNYLEARREARNKFLNLGPQTPNEPPARGKVLSGRHQAFGELCAPGAEDGCHEPVSSDSALGAFYRRLCSRMVKPRANTAVAHKLSSMVYFMLTHGEDAYTLLIWHQQT